MSEKESISRDAPLQDAALENHLRAVSADFRPTGRARLDPLAGARRRLTRALDFLRARAEQQTLTPAARWLVDNARMLEEAMTTLRGELRGAPALPARRGVPCVARFAAAWLSHTDGRADEESLRRAARAWQAARLLDEKELRLLPRRYAARCCCCSRRWPRSASAPSANARWRRRRTISPRDAGPPHIGKGWRFCGRNGRTPGF